MRRLTCVALRRTVDIKGIAPFIPKLGTISHKSCPTHSNHQCLPIFRVLRSKRLAGYVARIGRGRALELRLRNLT